MNLSQYLPWRRVAPPRPLLRPAKPDWVDAGSDPTVEPVDEVRRGCGWFDPATI